MMYKEADERPSSYYKTWLHWFWRDEEGEWPKRWALVPVWSFILLFLVGDTAAFFAQKVQPDYNKLFFEDSEEPSGLRLAFFLFFYYVFDFVRYHFGERFAVKFVNHSASWPPPPTRRNPVGIR